MEKEKYDKLGKQQGNFILGCINAIIIVVVFWCVVLIILSVAGII